MKTDSQPPQSRAYAALLTVSVICATIDVAVLLWRVFITIYRYPTRNLGVAILVLLVYTITVATGLTTGITAGLKGGFKERPVLTWAAIATPPLTALAHWAASPWLL